MLNDIELRPAVKGNLKLQLRSRVETFKGSGLWDEVIVKKEFPVSETAILLCDIWNKHWCTSATKRCESIAIKANSTVEAARKNGVQIVHAPSDTMDFYSDTVQRRRMISAPYVAPPEPLDLPSPPLPIDDSDGGCDCDMPEKSYKAWVSQHPAIKIGEYDGISDKGKEVYNLFQLLGVKNLVIMGVHTNMCVLGRSFAIKQMTRWGIRSVLVRDLTDAMYNPRRHPYVSHEAGTELVIQHIEKYWCPSILSDDLLNAYLD